MNNHGITRKTIKGFREALCYSRMDLARKVGVDQRTITRWEAGETKPSGINLIHLSEVLGCGVDNLMV